MKQLLIILSIFFSTVSFAEAYMPILVSQKSVLDVTVIADPTLEQTFYGSLADFPHTFLIVAKEPFYLSAHIFVPDTDTSINNISGIIVKEGKKGGRVEEVARFRAREAQWESVYEWRSGDFYRTGPSFEKELSSGVYRIEMSTPDNREQYIFRIGTRTDTEIGYFETLSRLVAVKHFMGKSSIRIIESPYVYLPLFGIIMLFIGYRMYSRRTRGVV